MRREDSQETEEEDDDPEYNFLEEEGQEDPGKIFQGNPLYSQNEVMLPASAEFHEVYDCKTCRSRGGEK